MDQEIFPYQSEYFPYVENLKLLYEIISLSGICWQNNQKKYTI